MVRGTKDVCANFFFLPKGFCYIATLFCLAAGMRQSADRQAYPAGGVSELSG